MTENGKKVLAQLAKDEKTKKALTGVKDVKQGVAILNANGYKCTEKDFEVDFTAAKNKKISLDEAKAVTGGDGGCGCAVAGGGGGSGLECTCFALGSGTVHGGYANCVCVGAGGGGTYCD